jgi:hypothetical protein
VAEARGMLASNEAATSCGSIANDGSPNVGFMYTAGLVDDDWSSEKVDRGEARRPGLEPIALEGSETILVAKRDSSSKLRPPSLLTPLFDVGRSDGEGRRSNPDQASASLSESCATLP